MNYNRKERKFRLSSKGRMLVYNYRQRHRVWTMAHLPSMPHDQWARYVAWVNAFGRETPPRDLDWATPASTLWRGRCDGAREGRFLLPDFDGSTTE